MKKGEKMSEKQRQKISKAKKGKQFTEEHRQKLSESHKGQIPSNLEQLRLYRKGRPLTEEHKKKLSESQKGKPKNISEESRKKMSDLKKGKPSWNTGLGDITKNCLNCKKEFVSKFSIKRKFCSQKCSKGFLTGEKHYRWIDNRENVVGRHKRDTHDPCVKQWRKKIFERDLYKCKLKNKECCGNIQAHHILRWSDFPDLRYEVSNGITLCRYHHPRTRKKEKEMEGLFKSLVS